MPIIFGSKENWNRIAPRGIRISHSEPRPYNPDDTRISPHINIIEPIFDPFSRNQHTLNDILQWAHGSYLSNDTIYALPVSLVTPRFGRSDLLPMCTAAEIKTPLSVIKKPIHYFIRKGGGSFYNLKQHQFPFIWSHEYFCGEEVAGSVLTKECAADSGNSLILTQMGCRTRIVYSYHPYDLFTESSPSLTNPRNVDYSAHRDENKPASQLSAVTYGLSLADLEDSLELLMSNDNLLIRYFINDFIEGSVLDSNIHIQSGREIISNLVDISLLPRMRLFELGRLPLELLFKIIQSIIHLNICIADDHCTLMLKNRCKHDDIHSQNITSGGEICDTRTFKYIKNDIQLFEEFSNYWQTDRVLYYTEFRRLCRQLSDLTHLLPKKIRSKLIDSVNELVSANEKFVSKDKYT